MRKTFQSLPLPESHRLRLKLVSSLHPPRYQKMGRTTHPLKPLEHDRLAFLCPVCVDRDVIMDCKWTFFVKTDPEQNATSIPSWIFLQKSNIAATCCSIAQQKTITKLTRCRSYRHWSDTSSINSSDHLIGPCSG